LGADGRSKVVEIRDIAGGMAPRFPRVHWNCVWTTAEQPPELSVSRRPRDAEWLNIQLLPGATRWVIFTFEPGLSTPFHHTATLDYDVILEGEVTLALEDGDILLGAGDCVVIPAAVHSWRTGDRGCIISVMYNGLEPPQAR
jgi:quercetin dioxygenase-like cupin family protein